MTSFSICIPNYNYGRYIGVTIRSVLAQQGDHDVEVCISDNASTDDSAEVVRSVDDPRVHLSVGSVNRGFAANLDRAAAMATKDVVIMLSSDDIMLEGALTRYSRLFDAVEGPTMAGSAIRVVDDEGARMGRVGTHPGLWSPDDHDPSLSEVVGPPVYATDGTDLLRRSVQLMRNPLHFASVAYHRTLGQAVGWYGGGRHMNPDKWFNWRMLHETTRVHYVDEELFGYRWHDANQTAQQAGAGVLKHLTDEYANSFQVPDGWLVDLDLTRREVEEAFMRQDIALRGFRDLADGHRRKTRRTVAFARATYPDAARRDPVVWALRGALLLGPIGSAMADLARRRVDERQAGSGTQHPMHETWRP